MLNKTPNRMHIFLYSLLFLIGLILSYYALKHYQYTQSILSNGIETDAEVVDYEKYFDGDSDIYKAILEFLDKSGNNVQYTSKIGSAQPSYEVGTKIRIFYNPSNVQEVKTITFWGLYRWTLILFSLASPFLVIGGGYLLYKFL